LKALNRENYTFDYMPVDISQNALDNLEADLNIHQVYQSRKTR
jgi:hypothetical protein